MTEHFFSTNFQVKKGDNFHNCCGVNLCGFIRDPSANDDDDDDDVWWQILADKRLTGAERATLLKKHNVFWTRQAQNWLAVPHDMRADMEPVLKEMGFNEVTTNKKASIWIKVHN